MTPWSFFFNDVVMFEGFPKASVFFGQFTDTFTIEVFVQFVFDRIQLRFFSDHKHWNFLGNERAFECEIQTMDLRKVLKHVSPGTAN